jgi:outer membrane protein assembly factor BamB
MKIRQLFLAPVVACILALSGCAPQQPAQPTSDPTVPPTVTPGENAAPSFDEIRARIAHLRRDAQDAATPASSPTAEADEQQYPKDMAALISSLKGKEVQDWQGWIVRVKEGQGGRYEVGIDMDELYDIDPFLTFEYRGVRRTGLADVVLADVSAEQAKALSAGQKVVLKGVISDLAGRPGEEMPIDPANARLAVVLERTQAEPLAQDGDTTTIDPKGVVITLTRPVCGMMSTRCYTYDLIVHGTGEVLYSEEDWETIDERSNVITRTYQVSEEKVRDLVAEFERIDYFSLKDDYNGYDMSDASSATTSITTGTKRKSIFHYHGDRSAPGELAQLENMIDEAVSSNEPTPTPLPTGNIKWQTKVGYRIGVPPTYADGLVYVSSEDTCLCALDAATGAREWTAPSSGGSMSRPIVAGGKVLFAGARTLDISPEIVKAGYVYALDAKAGTRKWDFETEDEEATAPVVAAGIAYFGGGQWSGRVGGYSDQPSGHLYAVDVASGKLVWKKDLPDADVWSAPVVAGGTLYFVDRTNAQGRDPFLYALDALTGQEKWKSDVLRAFPLAARGNVLYASTGESLLALDGQTGRQIWSYQADFGSFSYPLVTEDTLYVGVNAPGVIDKKYRPEANDNNYLAALDVRTGTERWKYVTECCISSPSLDGNVLYIAANDGIEAVNVKTGQAIWQFSTESFVQGLVSSAGVQYFGDFDGTFYAVEAP